MKKLLSILTMLVLSISMYAQREVTKFLGIPVDGTKSEMIRKLKAKGFKVISYKDGDLTGKFNGKEVLLNVQVNNNKVWRIGIADVYASDESQIKIRFNKLCQQFSNSPKYYTMKDVDYTLSDNLNIGFELLMHKQIEASFFQKPSKIDDNDDFSKRVVWFTILNDMEYGKYQILMFYENRYNAANGEDL